MAISLHELVNYTDTLLEKRHFKDYCPNGLQVEASNKVQRLITGVTASQALIDVAIEKKADAILVHHGYFWQGEAEPITGIKAKRIASLIKNNISLIAYHLPLDTHPVYGNNAQLAKLLGLTATEGLEDDERPIGLVGNLNNSQTLAEFAKKVSTNL